MATTATTRRHRDPGALRRNDGGFTMVGIAISLVAVAALSLIGIEATFGSSGAGGSGGSSSSGSGVGAGNPEVAMADHLQAQQSLSTALGAVRSQEGGAAGGTPGTPGALDGLGGATTGASGGVDLSQLQAAEPSLTFVAGPTTGPTTVSVGGASGAVTLATRSSDGVCWLVWSGSGGPWYGAQTGLASCTAPTLTSAPTAGPVSSTSIGWQTGDFPST